MTTWDRTLYRWLTDDDGDQRSCADIPDTACREAPRSFVLNAANGACTKLAEQLASPGLVLAWLLETAGAPVALVGWLEPLRQGGSMLPSPAALARWRSPTSSARPSPRASAVSCWRCEPRSVAA